MTLVLLLNRPHDNSVLEFTQNYLSGVGEHMSKAQICLHLALLLLSILASTRKKLLRGKNPAC